MGVSYYLECKKCRKTQDLLFDLEQEDAAESLETLFALSLDEPLDSKKLVEWVTKHSSHSDLVYNGS